MRRLLPLLLPACHTAPEGTVCADAEGLEDAALTIEQLDLGRGAIGEAALVTGPDGTTVWIDVGNDRHQATIQARAAQVDHLVLTHDDADHVDGRDAVEASSTWTWEQQELPLTLDLGEGAELVLFKADGRLATDEGMVDLWAEVGDPGGEDNPRSVVGVVRWGAFHYLFAGDLTGGGKGTLDVEGALVDRAAQLPWVPADGVTAMHVSHHGISSSTNAAWADWLQPEVAVVGANNAYLDAPSPEALAALPAHTRVYVTEDGRTGNADERTCIAHDSVTIEVGDGGDAWAVRLGPPD